MSDIVERLRALAPIEEALEAADEIERLRATLGMVKQSVLEAADEAERLQAAWDNTRDSLRITVKEIERLRAALNRARSIAHRGLAEWVGVQSPQTLIQALENVIAELDGKRGI